MQKPIRFVTSLKSITPVLVLEGIAFITILMYSGMIASFQLATSLWSWVYSALIVYVELYIIQMIGMQEVRQQSQEKLEFIQKKDENVQCYYRNLVSRLRSASELKDEYSEKLKAIYEQFRLEYSQEMSEKKIPNQEKQVLKSESAWNPQAIVEQIVDSKKREMDELGYSYDLDIRIPEEVAIELMDISGLLNNLLDNAVEAVHGYVENAKKNGIKCGQEKKEKFSGSQTEVYIRGNSYVEKDNFVIRVENVKSPEQKIVEIDDRFATSKTDKTGHGYGLQIIRRIAEKYDGRMDVSYTKEYFANKVTMKIK